MTKRIARLSPLVLVFASACTMVQVQSPGPTVTPTQAFDNARFDSVLQHYVDPQGRVDYAGLQGDRMDLDAYYAALGQISPDSHPDLFDDDNARLAYWLNAYNASVLVAVLNDYPIQSVKDVNPTALFFLPRVTGFFVLRRITLGGKKTNLYDLENKIIRKRFAEPRIHFALNCASTSCPRLPRRAFTATDLQSELERETRLFVSQDRNLRVDRARSRITLSAIFDWYESDFTDWMKSEHPDLDPTLSAYVRLYLDPERTSELDACQDCRVEFAPYDWSLNDQRRVN